MSNIENHKLSYDKAQFALRAGNWALAITLFQDIWEKFPQSYQAGFQLGIAQMSLKNWEGAINTYETLFSQGHNYPEVCCHLGISYWKQGLLRQALIFFRYSLKHYPYHAESRLNLASLYLSYQHFKKALKHYQILVNEYPDEIEYRFNLAATLQKCQILDEAIYHYRFILSQTPIHLDSFYNLACIYWQLKDYKAAHHFSKLTLKYRFHPELAFICKRIENEPISSQDHQAYVHALFENYATHYNFHMEQTLKYQAPQYLGDHLKRQNLSFGHGLDLACGTGLMGKHLKPFCQNLIGVDISKSMLVEAEKTSQYAALFEQDALVYLNNTGLQFDVVVAVEFFSYVSELTPVIQAIAQKLNPTGRFIFTIELGNDQLGDSGRMQFREATIDKALNDAGFNILYSSEFEARKHEGKWLQIMFFDAQKGNSN